MKKLVLFLSVCALLASAVWVGAAGDAGDPLASLSYLNGEFPNVQKKNRSGIGAVGQRVGRTSEKR